MPKRALTQLFVDRIGPPKTGRIEYWDTHLSGLGLRVSASGAKSWIAMYRIGRGGKQVRETLGSVDKVPSVAAARECALASIQKARGGIDPMVERKAAATRAKDEEQETFSYVADRFLAEHVERNCRPKTVRETRRIIESDLKPKLATRPIRSITRADINELLDEKAETRPLQANELRKHLRTLFAWARDLDLLETDPTNVRKRAKESPRDRVLSDDEIRLFWSGCDRRGWPFGPLFKLLLLTAQRREEVGAARWGEFDLTTWCIPRERAKNDKAHEVHLSAFALELLDSLPRTGDLLFASRGGVPSGYSKAKERLDGYMAERGAVMPWVLHDLRRTATSGMARLGVAPHVVDKILNHSAGTIRGVAATYNKFQYLSERQAALEAWGRFVEQLVRPGGAGNVVDLRQRAATA